MSMMSNKVWTAHTEFNGTIKKANLMSIFTQLAEQDDDFNGNNGDEYLWDSAEENGFESNEDYLTDRVLKNIEPNQELSLQEVGKLIDEFLSEWTGNDNYYTGVDFDFVVANNVLFVAVSVTTD